MAEKSRIQGEEVFAAIEQLLKVGEAPTHMSVRQALGGRGSGPVLSRLIGLWFKEHGEDYFAKVAYVRSRAPADDFSAHVLEVAGRAAQVVSDAERERQKVLDSRECAADEREAELARREELLVAEHLKLNERASEQERLIAELKSDKGALSAGLERAREDRLRVEAELGEAATSLATLNVQLGQALQDSAGARVRELTGQQALADARRELAGTRQIVEQFQAAHADAMTAVHQLQQSEQLQRQELRDQVQRGEERERHLNTQLEAQMKELKEVSGRESLLQDKLAESSEALAAALRDSHALASAMAGHLRMVDQLREERDAAAGHAASLADSLAVIAANVKK